MNFDMKFSVKHYQLKCYDVSLNRQYIYLMVVLYETKYYILFSKYWGCNFFLKKKINFNYRGKKVTNCEVNYLLCKVTNSNCKTTQYKFSCYKNHRYKLLKKCSKI